MTRHSPTANLTTARVIMQKAAQENLILHHMYLKTAYLHAPIDWEIYMEQPEGYDGEQSSTPVITPVFNPQHFLQNPADHSVYIRETEKEKVILIIWVDDLIIAASDENAVMNVKEFAYSKIPHERFRSSETFSGH